MDAGQEITVADVRAALQRQNMQESDIKQAMRSSSIPAGARCG